MDTTQSKNPLNIEWLKCHHGVLKSGYCEQCEKEKLNLFAGMTQHKSTAPTRIAIKRGCPSGPGPCFCTGVCQDVIGYRDPIFPGEH